MANMKVGFVGVGKMGTPMATRLVNAGYEVTVYDVDKNAVQELANAGAKAAASARDVADAAEIVFASLPSPQILEKVVLGDGGIAEGKAVKIFVDISTTGPRVAAKVAEGLAEHEVSIARLLQHPNGNGAALHVVTHEARAGDLDAALGALERLPEVHKRSRALPVVSDRGVTELGWA